MKIPALALALLPAAAHDGTQADDARFMTSRASRVELPLPGEEDAFCFAVFGDRTGGPREGVAVLRDAVRDVNLIEPDLVMTVGDLIEGYNQTPLWMAQMVEFRSIMDGLTCPWFPVAGNHDIYWRGPEKPDGEHEESYEAHFGPLWYAFRHKFAWFVVLYTDEGDPETGVKDFNLPSAQRMSPEQMAWLEETLARAADAEHVFVFVHHPRWLGGHYGDDWERVHRLLVDAGNVTAVFGGHIHRMRYDPRDGIEYFSLATVGGHQNGYAAEAGWLHHYDVVTVRRDRIAVGAFPVGAALDPRAITGDVGDAAAVLARWRPEVVARPALTHDLGVEGDLALRVSNPVDRAIEVQLTPQSDDSRWRFRPDHAHLVVEPGASADVVLRVARADGLLDDSWRQARVDLAVDWLGEGLRVPMPPASMPVPLDKARLPAPLQPRTERAFALDGTTAVVRVDPADLELPDGPLTLEGWLHATVFRDRQGFLCKTENSEFGIFLNGGRPVFYLHLDGAYATAEATEPVLEPNRWHHVAAVFDGVEMRLYVDGALTARTAASGTRTQNGLPFLVGADVDGQGRPTSPFEGLVDEVRLSRVARYAGAGFEPARRHEPDEDTALLLHADGAVGPWAHDASPSRAHAELVGGARIAGAGR